MINFRWYNYDGSDNYITGSETEYYFSASNWPGPPVAQKRLVTAAIGEVLQTGDGILVKAKLTNGGGGGTVVIDEQSQMQVTRCQGIPLAVV